MVESSQPATTGDPVTIDDVRLAARRISPHIHRTPVMTSATIDRITGARVMFKCENLQKVGAFKARGALNAVLGMGDTDVARGVITHSSGNHGQALAYAAAIRGVRCWVVMPDHAPQVKVDAVRGYGAEVVFCAHAERDQVASAVAAETGAVFVHPFDDPMVIAGQGTAALEFLEQVPALDVLITPIGGGGLLSGTVVAATGSAPATTVIGAEPEAVDDAARSLATGVRQPAVPRPDTLADGLLTGIGALPFDILAAAGTEIITVDEEAIRTAATLHLERMKLVVEPSGATGLAAVMGAGERFRGASVGVVISGGNTDLSWYRSG